MSKPIIYLAGKMSGLSFDEMNNWRKEITALLKDKTDTSKPLNIINPVHYYNFEMDRSTYTDKEVMEFDLWAVRNSKLIIVNFDYPDSIGTAIELYEATQKQIPVIAYGGLDVDVHPWIKQCVTKWCETMEDVVEYIVDFYLPNI